VNGETRSSVYQATVQDRTYGLLLLPGAGSPSGNGWQRRLERERERVGSSARPGECDIFQFHVALLPECSIAAHNTIQRLLKKAADQMGSVANPPLFPLPPYSPACLIHLPTRTKLKTTSAEITVPPSAGCRRIPACVMAIERRFRSTTNRSHPHQPR